MESNLFSHVMVIKQIYFHVEVSDSQCFDGTCNSLVQSGRFKRFSYPDRTIFTEHFRERGEVSRTFEIKKPIQVSELDLVGTKLTGEIRVLLTIYRAGFLVLSLVHSVIPKREEGQPRGKNLTPDEPLNMKDVIFLIEEQMTGKTGVLKYGVQLVNQRTEIGTSDLVEHLLKELEAHGIVTRREPRVRTNVVRLWSPHISSTFKETLDKNYRELFLAFTAPHVETPKELKKEILKKLEPCVFWFGKNRGFLFKSNSMLIISPVFRPPHKLLSSPLPWIFQLAALQNFMLQFYSREVRTLSSEMSALIANKPSDLLSRVFKLTASLSLGLEDLYWVEGDLFRLQSTRFIIEYKNRLRLDEKLETLQRRYIWIKERCTEAMGVLQQKAEREREKSMTYLTLIFATFGFGEVLSSFVVWYFSSLQSNAPMIPNSALITGLSIPFAAICVLYLVSRWYVSRKYRQGDTR